MEEVDENEGYYSEDEQEECKEGVSKPAPVINFLADDDIQPFSFGSIRPKAVEKPTAV